MKQLLQLTQLKRSGASTLLRTLIICLLMAIGAGEMWAKTTYTVTYNGNGNTGGTAPSQQTGSSSYTVSGRGDFEKTGYWFKCWNTAANGSGTTYYVGSTIRTDATLYAQWTNEPVKTVNGTTTTWDFTKIVQSDCDELTNWTDSKDGYFSSPKYSASTYLAPTWCDGIQIGQNDNSINSDRIRVYYDGVHGVYFNHTIGSIKVTIPSGANTIEIYSNNKIKTNNQGVTLTAITGGYKATVNANDVIELHPDNINTYITKIITKAITTTYSVTCDTPTNGTLTATPTSNVAEGATVTVTPSANTGYELGSLYYVKSGEETQTSISNNTFTMPASDVTVYATFNAKTYTITYKDQNNATFSGTHADGYPTTHTYGTATTLDTPTKTGYIFGGYYTTSDCSGTAVTTLGATDYTANITLYAKWDVLVTCKLTFTSGTSTAQTWTNGDFSQFQVTANNLSCTLTAQAGYRLKAYKMGFEVATDPTFSDVTYTLSYTKNSQASGDVTTTPATRKQTNQSTPGSVTVTNIDSPSHAFTLDTKSSTILGTVLNYTANILSLSAVCVANNYTVVYDANGGSGTMTDATTHTYGTPFTLQKNTFTSPKEDYVFTGWNTASDGTGISYKDEQSLDSAVVENNTVVTLYAQWKQQVVVEDGKTVVNGEVTDVSKVTESLPANLTSVDMTNATATDEVINTIVDAAQTKNSNALVYAPSTYTSTDKNNVIVKSGDTYSCSKFVLSDKKDFAVPTQFTAGTTKYTRKVYNDGLYQTLMLPVAFTFPNNDTRDKYVVEKCEATSLNEGGASVTFTHIRDDVYTFEANTPYIIRSKEKGSDTDAMVFTAAANAEVSVKSISEQTGLFRGVYVKTALSDISSLGTIYAISSDGSKFVKAAEGSTFSQFRAILVVPSTSGAKAATLTVLHEDIPTGISDVKANAANGQSEEIYNLSGQKVSNTSHGIFIVNGKKVLK